LWYNLAEVIIMLTSTEIASASAHVGEERAVEMVARAGFDAWDLSLLSRLYEYNWSTGEVRLKDHPLSGRERLAFARRLKRIGEDNGIFCNQSHAPFPTYSQGIRDLLKSAIELTAEAGGKICVVHPDHYKTAEENAEMYLSLLPFAKEHNVKLATENMWFWNEEKNEAYEAPCGLTEDFIAHVDAVGDPFLVACVDIGHAEMLGDSVSAARMIRGLGHRVESLHIHDNDLCHDSHQIPFSMKIDFSEVVRALKDIGYTGELTLEADSYLKNRGDSVLEGLREMASVARRLSDMFEEL
jgi:sugar phosphate isomerase/epimerase